MSSICISLNSTTSDECEGKYDGDLCSDGVCFKEQCVECYEDEHCGSGEECGIYNTCQKKAGPGGDGEGVSIVLILVIAAVGAAAAIGILLFRKMKKGGHAAEEEGFSGEGGEETFDDEEFY